MAIPIRRREFIVTLGGAAAAWPLATRAQQPQPQPMRHIGVLAVFAKTDPVAQSQITAMVQRLQELGWIEGRNVQIDFRWNAVERGEALALAEELVATRPELIIACGGQAAAVLAQATRSVPIVFVQVIDPVELGVVASLAHPGGNITGFSNFELTMAGKWLETLRDVAPGITRGVVVFDPENPASRLYLDSVENAAASFGMNLVRAGVRDAAEIEHALGAFADQSTGALIVLPNAVTQFHRDLTIALAARYRLPAIYPYRFYPANGGLMSYGVDLIDLYRQSASYVDRILKGARPADLPVQQPTKFELVINLKTAKVLGLAIPEPFLQSAAEVIE
jgi:putative tryptophan/tyrosine transport system substrate-binding protein